MAAIRRSIKAYAPWDKGADDVLLRKLICVDNSSYLVEDDISQRLQQGAVVAAPSQTQSDYDHPFRLVPVRTCLSEMKNMFFTDSTDFWNLSQPATQLSGKKLFLEHVWLGWRRDYAGHSKALRATLQHYSKDSVWIGTPQLLVRRSCIA